MKKLFLICLIMILSTEVLAKQKTLPINCGIELNPSLQKPLLSAMHILNDLPRRFPEAISLAPGKPADRFCRPDIMEESLKAFKLYAKTNYSVPYNRLLGQYGRVEGIINDIIVKHAQIDEGINASNSNVVVTVGFQEAATLCVLTLFNKNDVLLVPDPGYIGVTGIASVCGVDIEGIKCNKKIQINEIEKSLQSVIKSNRRPKALYIAPSFCNPQGTSISKVEREQLLRLADKYNFYIIEDATYNLFNYDVESIAPSLKSIDRKGRVIYIGSFAKSLYPSLRIGYIIAGQTSRNDDSANSLIQQIIKVKSYTSINTPALDQAIVGGFLIKNNYSLKHFLASKKKFFANNRDVMIRALEKNLSTLKDVSWTYPKGGFFITLKVPFNFNKQMLEECAAEFKVIVLPMYLLSLDQSPSNLIRLSFATTSESKINLAIENLSKFIKLKLSVENNLTLGKESACAKS